MSIQTPEQIWKGLSPKQQKILLLLHEGDWHGRMATAWNTHEALAARVLMSLDGDRDLTPLGQLVAEHGRSQSETLLPVSSTLDR